MTPSAAPLHADPAVLWEVLLGHAELGRIFLEVRDATGQHWMYYGPRSIDRMPMWQPAPYRRDGFPIPQDTLVAEYGPLTVVHPDEQVSR